MSTCPLTTEELFRRHRPFVLRLLLALGLQTEVAEDALQEVFLVVHRQEGYRPGAAAPTTYLASIAIQVARTHRRRKRLAAARFIQADTDLTSSPDPVHELELREDLRRLTAALSHLPKHLSTTLVQVELAGESCIKLAANLQVPVNTIYSRKHAAHKRLQSLMSELDSEVGAFGG